jgi:hypothetical protein
MHSPVHNEKADRFSLVQGLGETQLISSLVVHVSMLSLCFAPVFPKTLLASDQEKVATSPLDGLLSSFRSTIVGWTTCVSPSVECASWWLIV